MLTNNKVKDQTSYKTGGKWADSIIRIREFLLSRFTGVGESNVLNLSSNTTIPRGGIDLASELKQSLDEIKLAAIDENGYKVDYSGLIGGKAYQEYRSQCSPLLQMFDPMSLDTVDKQLSFWINLYNVLMIDAVIAFGTQQSVTEGKLGIITFFRRAAYNVSGLRVSCEDIEHGILRGNRGNPYLPGRHFLSGDPHADWVVKPPDVRVHFALNCASRSCPPVQFYSADCLGLQLDQAAENFVNENVEIDKQQNALSTSEIFRWFEGDFGGRHGVIKFLSNYLPDDYRKKWIDENKKSIRMNYVKYDWGLNA